MSKIKQLLILIAGVGLMNVCQADSVNEWGPWQAEDDVVAAILAGADPVEVTAPTAAGPAAGGSVAQSVIPVALDNPNITQEGMPRNITVAPAALVSPVFVPIDNLDVAGSVLVDVENQTPAGEQAPKPSFLK
jgi:hypothetical protein